VHRALVDVLSKNGVQLRNTYQINSGGNMDFLNMQDADRMQSKNSPFAIDKLLKLNFREMLRELGGKAGSPGKSRCYPLAV